jgi:hypothetical protein
MSLQRLPRHPLTLVLVAALVTLAGACSTDSPSEPRRETPPPGGGGGGAASYVVTVTVQPGTISAGSTEPVIVTVRAVRTDNGQPAPTGTLAQVVASAGSFGAVGGPASAIIELTNGSGQVAYFPPLDSAGTVVIRATVAGSAGQANLVIEEPATFFISHVEPATGSPQGGEQVTIVGNAFEEPVRVEFGGVNARVLSVSESRIRVITPPTGNKTGTTTVPVSVTINLNEEDVATDTLGGAFTYVPGGGPGVDQPAIFSVTPTTGANEGGTNVSIIGEGFQTPVQVEFCGGSVCLEAQVLSVSPGRIEVRSPAATGFGSSLRNSSVDIRVRNLATGLTATRTGAFQYGIQIRVTGLAPDVVDADAPALVTIFGEGFESPLQVLAGGIQQQVISVTGTQVTFRPSPFPINGCPPPGAIVGSRGITVRLLTSGTDVSAPAPGLSFSANVPRPVITGINPTNGPAAGNTLVTITGTGFDPPVRIEFGNVAGSVQGTPTATQAQVRTPAFTGSFPTETCTAAGGAPGTRQTPVAVDVTLQNLDTTCEDVLPGGFVYNPDGTCIPNEAPEVECTDGFDNDSDGFIDAADPECTGPTDDDESA